jgi:hypothetical protein
MEILTIKKGDIQNIAKIGRLNENWWDTVKGWFKGNPQQQSYQETDDPEPYNNGEENAPAPQQRQKANVQNGAQQQQKANAPAPQQQQKANVQNRAQQQKYSVSGAPQQQQKANVQNGAQQKKYTGKGKPVKYSVSGAQLGGLDKNLYTAIIEDKTRDPKIRDTMARNLIGNLCKAFGVPPLPVKMGSSCQGAMGQFTADDWQFNNLRIDLCNNNMLGFGKSSNKSFVETIVHEFMHYNDLYNYDVFGNHSINFFNRVNSILDYLKS